MGSRSRAAVCIPEQRQTTMEMTSFGLKSESHDSVNSEEVKKTIQRGD